MRSWFLALVVVAAWCGTAAAQEDKKTDVFTSGCRASGILAKKIADHWRAA
jgi:hypothetical protein